MEPKDLELKPQRMWMMFIRPEDLAPEPIIRMRHLTLAVNRGVTNYKPKKRKVK